MIDIPTLIKKLPLRPILIAGCVLMISVFTWYTITRAPRVTHGFVVYYTNARMILEGEDFQKAYDYDYFNAKMREYGIQEIMDVPHNLPTNALLLAPLAWLSPEETKVVLSAASYVCILASLFILLRLHGVRIQENLGMALAILFLAWRPLYDNIYLGQIYAILLLLFCFSMLGIKKAGSTVYPLPLSVAFLFKGHGAVPMLWLVVQKNWKTLLVALLSVLIVLLATLPVFGLDAWGAYISTVVSKLGTNPTDAGTSYQTINSLVYHLFTYDPQWVPSPVVILPGFIVRMISYLLNIALIVYVLVSGHRASGSARVASYSAAVAAGVVTAPLAEGYAFTLFLPLIVTLVIAISKRFQRIRTIGTVGWISLAAILVLASPIRYEFLPYATFPLVLLAYMKLCAGVAVLCCFGRMARSPYFDQAELRS